MSRLPAKTRLTTEISALARNLRMAISLSSLSMSVEMEGLCGRAKVMGGEEEVTEEDGVTIGARGLLWSMYSAPRGAEGR